MTERREAAPELVPESAAVTERQEAAPEGAPGLAAVTERQKAAEGVMAPKGSALAVVLWSLGPGAREVGWQGRAEEMRGLGWQGQAEGMRKGAGQL